MEDAGDDASRRGTGGHRTATLLVFGLAACLRTLVGMQPHSGQDNFHGARDAYGGDFEAQRHWMELTLHVPIGDWYFYDLDYWGLDYPPITAYVSYLCGLGSHRLVGPHATALESSRGIEDRTHKAYMRATVLVLDMVVYGPAVWLSCTNGGRTTSRRSLWLVLLVLLQPAIVLVDHGHFQYNTVALGWSVMAFYFMTDRRSFGYCVLGALFFCLALNFKQMTLYYAPVVFAYLLGRCLAQPESFLKRFAMLGITVVAVFASTWAPFVWNGPSHADATPIERVAQILHRIFPFQRGLFESKVANLWCALSTNPVSIRDRLPEKLQPVLALGLTVMLMLPSCIALFRIGAANTADATNTTDKRKPFTRNDFVPMLWGATSCSLSFFLASFQVHEKSILMSLAPASLLFHMDDTFVRFFTIACAWTLWPLLQVDRLELAYVCVMAIYLSTLYVYRQLHMSTTTAQSTLSFFASAVTRPLQLLAYVGMLGLHTMQVFVDAPPHLPDLYPVLWSIGGCGMFVLSWIGTLWHLTADRRKLKVD